MLLASCEIIPSFVFFSGLGWGVEGRAEAFILKRDAEEELNLEMRKSFDSPAVAPTLSLLSVAKRWL